MSLIGDVLNGQTWMLKPQGRLAIYREFFGEDCLLKADERRLLHFEEFVLEKWEATTFKALEADLGGTKINNIFLRRAVMGQDTVANPIAHLALISALWTERSSKLKAGVSEAPPRTKLSDSLSTTLQLFGIPTADFIATLSQVADEERLSVDICIRIADGVRFDKFANEAGLSMDRMYRLRLSIDEGLRSLTPNGNFSLAALRRQIRVLAMRERHRSAILATVDTVIKGTGVLARTGSTQWCIKHDKQWIDKVRAEVKTEHFRHRILCRKAQGQLSQGRVWIEDPTAFRWLALHDTDWFNENVPDEERKVISPETRNMYRNSITKAIQSGSGQLPGNAALWCLRNDSAWFQTIIPLPEKRRGGTDLFISADEMFKIDEIRQKCREVICKAISAGRNLPVQARVWSFNFDREWLDQVSLLPPADDRKKNNI